MIDSPGVSHHGGGVGAWLPALALLGPAAAYGVGLARLHRRGDRWPRRRTLAAAGSVSCLAVALLPPMAGADGHFVVHVSQHLLVASFAPLLLALSAPVTLALRTLRGQPRRLLLRLLHSRLVGALTSPIVVLALYLGGLYLFYLTPLFGWAADRPAAHAAVHLHMLAAGCLLSWYLIRLDPMPRRAGLRTRLGVLLIAAGGHDVLAKLLYAAELPADGGSPAQLRAGAQLMYYGGDAAEVLLAVAVLAGWYASTGRGLRRRARRRDPHPESVGCARPGQDNSDSYVVGPAGPAAAARTHLDPAGAP